MLNPTALFISFNLAVPQMSRHNVRSQTVLQCKNLTLCIFLFLLQINNILTGVPKVILHAINGDTVISKFK